MQAITRCPNCQTRFHVSAAHLNAHGGKVRCGRCAFVFDATAHFIQIEEAQIEVATPIPAPVPQPEHAVAQEAEQAYGLGNMASQLHAAAALEREEASGLAAHSLEQLAQALQRENLEPQPGQVDLELDLDLSEFAAQRLEPVLHIEPEPALDQVDLPEPDPEPSPVSPTATPAQAATVKTGYHPIFTAEDERLLRPPPAPSPWRWLWLIPSLLAMLTLCGQLIYHYRHELLVQVPGLSPKLQRFCALTGCRVKLPARSQYLRTEWNELVALPERPELIQLNATLRNDAPFVQAMPMLELTLHDDNEQIVARKVFKARDYIAPQADGSLANLPKSLAPQSELRVFLQLDIGKLQSSAYVLRWFYPQEN